MRKSSINKIKQPGASNEPVKMAVKTSREIVINRSPSEVYSFWRDFENLPQFMRHVEDVKVVDERKSHWVINGPSNKTFEWDAEITSDRPNEFISWRSYGNSEIEQAGSVEFRPFSDSATQVVVTLAYNPPAGTAGHILAKMIGEAPEQQMEEDLKNLKNNLEEAA
jgi:uncharacterized membrane protein